MKTYLLFFVLAAFVIVIAACPKANLSTMPDKCGCSQQDPLTQCKAFPNGRNGFCADSICPTRTTFCSFLPYDVDVSTGVGYDEFTPVCQTPFDWFSWQTFIALNWPANPDGSAMNVSLTAAPDAPRVWEMYEGPDDIFGKQLSAKGGLTVFGSISKAGFDHFNGGQSDLEAFTEKPLIDRNLNFVLYEVRVNPEEVKYIKNNGLNTYCGQDSFDKKNKVVQFPLGSYSTKTYGAIEIKASWRILVPGTDDTSRYYKRRAIVSVDKDKVVGGQKAIYDTVWVGLIAMHIIRRVGTEGDNWIWSSFEHEDNAPLCTAGCPTDTKNYTFYNPACTSCKLNQPPSLLKGDSFYLWSPAGGNNPQYARRYANNGQYGTQVGRIYPVRASTVAVTEQWHQQLKISRSVWQYYHLVGSQWASEENGKATVGIPLRQANTVVETYLQRLDTVSGLSGSCVSCHAIATTSTGKNANFSFLLGGLKPSDCGGK